MTSRTAGVEALMRADSIAVLGASDDPTRIGGRPVQYLKQAQFAGRIYPVNPNRSQVQGLPAYPSVGDLPEVPDVGMIIVPAAATLAAVRDCAASGVRVAIVASAGFAEADDVGAELQAELVRLANAAEMSVLGPNCLGAFNASTGFFPTFATALSRGFPEPGPIGVASQSGAYGAHAVYLARQRGLGVGAMVTTGNEADIDVADVIAWMAEDPEIRIVLAYAEGVRDGRRLIEAVRKASETGTRVVFLKVGSSAAGSRAASSHTASLAGADEVFDAVCRQYGVYRATSAEEQIDVAYALVHGLGPAGDRLGIVTVSGGAGVHLCDAADRFGLRVPVLNASSQTSIARLLPYASVTNPVDVTAQSLQQVDLLTHALREVLASGDVDVVIAYFTTTLLAKAFADVLQDSIVEGTAQRDAIPVVLVMVADPDIVRGFEDQGFPVFEDTERAVRAIAATRQLAAFGESNVPVAEVLAPAEPLPPGPFNELEAAELMAAAGIPMAPQRLAPTAEEAVDAAEELGYPVVLKVCSPDIIHKTDAGGVELGLSDADAVRAAFARVVMRATTAVPGARIDGVLIAAMVPLGVEVIIGLAQDPAFGPIVMVGLGGVHVEILKDVSFRVLPVDEAEAIRMLDDLRGRSILNGVRGAPAADVKALGHAIAALSRFGDQHAGEIETVEVNPLSVRVDGVTGLDAVVNRR